MNAGFVSLVGAGPGRRDHLTMRAARRLREADVVLHDALVSEEVLALAAQARLIDVGKRGRGRKVEQAEILRILILCACEGLRVVRLKGGDSFVFGRGGEEALALIEAGIPFEVVPGITSAVAAPELAGIPVTHRGISRGFAVVTGSPLDALEEAVGALVPGRLTLVVLMATQARAEVAAALRNLGWRSDLPCALIVGAATDRAWTWRGTLAELPAVIIPSAHADVPGTIVVGDVVALPIVLVDGGLQAHTTKELEGAVYVGAR